MMRRRLELWLVALVCLGPFALAALTYYGPWDLGWLPQLPGNRTLFDPPIALPPKELIGPDGPVPLAGPHNRWLLIYARMTACEEQCRRDLERLEQVRLALGRDLNRVQRVFLHGGEAARLAAEGELLTGRLDAGDAGDAPLLQLLGEQPIEDGRIFIADPLGRLVASYPADVEQRELLRDLERLLDLSGVG